MVLFVVTGGGDVVPLAPILADFGNGPFYPLQVQPLWGLAAGLLTPERGMRLGLQEAVRYG